MLSKKLTIGEIPTDYELSEVVELIAKENLPSYEYELSIPEEFDIDGKISHNKLDAIRESILWDAGCQGIMHNVYSNLEAEGKRYRATINRNLKEYYLEHKDKYKQNQVLLMKKIIETTFNAIRPKANQKGIKDETLSYAIKITIGHAFLMCSIFENPNGYYDIARQR